MQQRFYTLLVFFLTLSVYSQAQTVVDVTDATLVGNTTYNWTKDNIYLLDGLVFLEAGSTLNIEEGTVIKAKGTADVTTGDNTSALIVTRDAQIFAEGTEDEPIIFTASADDTTDPDDLDATDKGLWGGLIVLGDAVIARPGGEDGIEGIDAGEMRARFGGTDNEDNSGILRYVSIRHGGAALAPGDEINGLTLGGVGSATVVEYVEVLSNLDDGIEIFGGTVDIKYASVAFCGDDGFDWDFGWRGNGQFWFVIQGVGPGDVGRAGEHDGANGDDLTPFSQPTIYNATYIGSGTDPMPFPGGEGNDLALLFRDNTGGFYNNSIFTSFPGAGLAIEDRDDTASDAFTRFEAGELALNNNFFFDFAAGSAPADIFLAWDQGENIAATSSTVASILTDAGNSVTDPGLAGISRIANNMLDPRIDAGGAALTPIAPPTDAFFNSVSFRGAFGNSNLWISNWTALDEYGYLGDLVDPVISTADCITITDSDLVAGETYTWSNTNCYLLDGLVFLEEGGTLNIEAGTVIKAKSANDVSTGDNTSALIITRDATINALGEAGNPIIFTAESDDTNDPDDLAKNDRGLWGGLIVLGDAVIARPGGEDGIEGIDAGEARARFGGTEDDDNSGILRYVSIRHGGAALAPGDEINGLTLGGVGSATEVQYVEVLSNLDDGIEIFGGTVSIKYASVAFCGDDGFDWDFGWRGNGQFWFVLQDAGPGDAGRAGEHDGANGDDLTPFSQPTIYNATYIGSGTDPVPFPGGEGNDLTILFRDNTGGYYYNSVFTDFPGAAIAVEDRDDTGSDAFARLQAGELALNNNIFGDYGAGNTPADLFLAWDQGENIAATSADVVANLTAAGNTVTAPGIASISRDPDMMLDPRADAGSAALNPVAPATDPFFNVVSFSGAFGNSNLWLEGWTALDEYGFLGDLVDPVIPSVDCITITDADLVAGGTYNWSADNCYVLDGLVYLEEGGTLNIPAGTDVKFKAANDVTTGDNTSALIITRDATINVLGTEDAPVIFTAEVDDTSDPFDLDKTDRGLWGGLIVLGDAVIARPGGEDGIEGIDAGEDRARFGGTENDDNSGILRYLSIRHGGAALAPGDEINGLTLGGIGSGTIVEHVEVLSNLDDGIEIFGGTVDVKWAAVAFCGDDSYDYDFGWRGRGQFWFSMQDAGPGDAGRAGEHDGANGDDLTPFSQPTIYNATYIGSGTDPMPFPGGEGNDLAVLFRDNTGGFYNNSIFTDFPGRAIAVEDRDDTESDAFARLQAGELALNDNIFFDFGQGDTPTDLFVAWDQGENVAGTSTDVINTLAASGNEILNPNIINISRSADRMLDPRPGFGPAYSGAISSSDDFFTPAAYYGAFNPDAFGTWMHGWTALDEYEILAQPSVDVVDPAAQQGFILDAPRPTPSSAVTTIAFELPRAAEVSIEIYDLMGRQITTLANRSYSMGEQFETFDVSALPNGMYTIMLRAKGIRLVQKLLVTK